MEDTIVFLNNNSDKKLLAIGERDFLMIDRGLSLQKCSDFVEKHAGKYLFGFLSYDLKNEIEELSSLNADRIGFPLLYFVQPELVLEIDREGSYKYLQGESGPENDEKIASFLKEERAQNKNNINLESTLTKKEYLRNVEVLKNHIQQGDIYEVTFCQEFYNDDATINPAATYFRLNEKTNAPFSCYFQYRKKHLISGSPERFLMKRGEELTSQPIKGTARRSCDERIDNEIKSELLQSEKERSENVMIVDLVRNDLSRLALKNSVEVEELFGLYSFQTVHQLISTVKAKIPSHIRFDEIIRAMFPMGSMTGAPKIRAMKLIEKYEKFKRGLFSGSVGYISPEGDFDFNVVIRSILYDAENKRLSCPVGGAITIQSDPEKEYEECLLKVEAMKSVLNE